MADYYPAALAAAEVAIHDELRSSREVEPEALARVALEAAAPILAEATGVTVTEWGCRYDEEFVQRVHDEAMARKIARAGKSLGHVPVSRKMTIGPWEEVPDVR